MVGVYLGRVHRGVWEDGSTGVVSVPWLRYSSRFCSTSAVTASTAWRVPPPMCGDSTTLFQRAKLRWHIRFMSEHVKSGAR